MRYFTLQRVPGKDNLALILNAYLKALGTLDQLTVPRETMGEYMRLLNERSSPQKRETPSSKECEQLFDWRGPRFFMLQVLSNSLNDWHKNVGWAIKQLKRFFRDYAGNLHRFAVENRLKVLEEFGSDEDADYNADDTIKRREDAEALSSFTLAAELRQYFAGGDTRGECIGTSHAPDYAYFTGIVRRESEFCILKAFEAFSGQQIRTAAIGEDGSLTPETLGDRVERDLNQDLTNARVVAWFELALARSAEAAALFQGAETADDFRALLNALKRLRALDYPEPDAYLLAAEPAAGSAPPETPRPGECPF